MSAQSLSLFCERTCTYAEMPIYNLKKFNVFTSQKAIFIIHEQTYFIIINSRQMSNNDTYTPGPAHFNANLMPIIVLGAGAVTPEAPL